MKKFLVALSLVLVVGLVNLGTASADPGDPPIIDINSVPTEKQ